MCLRNMRDDFLLPGKRRLWSAITFILKLADQDLLLKNFPKSKDFILHGCYKLLEEEIYNHYR